MPAHKIAVLPGDGIGKEVVPAAQQVLDKAAEMWGFELTWTEFPWSCEYFREHNRMMPTDAIDQLAAFDEVFLGAVGDPAIPDHVSLWGLLIPIRRSFRQYVNLRPIKLLDGIQSVLRDVAEPIDFLVVRENNEGEYSEVGGRLYEGTPQELAVQESIFTRTGVERVMEYAFDLAAGRGGKVVSATKSNGIIHTMPFWDQIGREVAARYPDIELEEVHIDALAAHFTLRPTTFDVVVASNLFGDILTDLGAALVGSIGIAPSANLNPERAFPSMFEPIHGSAPDIAGKGVANPIGQIWSGAMMLEHIGYPEAGEDILAAVEDVLAGSQVRTPDLGGTAGTSEVTDAVVAALERTSNRRDRA